MYGQRGRGGNTVETQQHEEFRDELLQEIRTLLNVQYGQPDIDGAIRRIGEELETRDQQIEELEGETQSLRRNRGGGGGTTNKVKNDIGRFADRIRDECDDALEASTKVGKTRYGEAPSAVQMASRYNIILCNLAEKCSAQVNEIHASLEGAQEAGAPPQVQKQSSFQEKRLQREVDDLRKELSKARAGNTQGFGKSFGRQDSAGGGVDSASARAIQAHIDRIRDNVSDTLTGVSEGNRGLSQAELTAKINISLCSLAEDVAKGCGDVEDQLRRGSGEVGRSTTMDDADRREMEERLRNLQDEMNAAKREIDTKNRELKKIALTGEAGAYVTGGRRTMPRSGAGDYDDVLRAIKLKIEGAKQDAFLISEDILAPLRDVGLDGVARTQRDMVEGYYEQIEQTVENVNDKLEDVLQELDNANDLIKAEKRKIDDLETMIQRLKQSQESRGSVTGVTRQSSNKSTRSVGSAAAGIRSKEKEYKLVIQDLMRQLRECKNQCGGLQDEVGEALDRVASTQQRSGNISQAEMAAHFNIVLCRLAEFVAKTSSDVDVSLNEVIEELGSCEELLLENDRALQDMQAQLSDAQLTASQAEQRAQMMIGQHVAAAASPRPSQMAAQQAAFQASSYDQSKVAAATGFFNDLARIKAMAESALEDADQDQFRDTTRIIAQKNQHISRLEVELEENRRLLMEKDQTIHSIHGQLAMAMANQQANVNAAVAGAYAVQPHPPPGVAGPDSWRCDLCGTNCQKGVSECTYCGALKESIASQKMEDGQGQQTRARTRDRTLSPDQMDSPSDSSSSEYEDEDTLAPLGGAPKTQHKGRGHKRNASMARYQQELGGNEEDTAKAYELVKATRAEFVNLKIDDDEDLPLSEEARNFVKLFRKHDHDSTGTMSAEQLTSILVQHPDIHLDPEQVREIVMLAAEVAGVTGVPPGEEIYYVKFANFLAPTSPDKKSSPDDVANNQQLQEEIHKWKSKYKQAKAQLDSGGGGGGRDSAMETERILDLEQERETLMQKVREMEVQLSGARRAGGGGDLVGVIQRKDAELESLEKIAEEHGEIIRKLRSSTVGTDQRNEALQDEVQKATAQADQYEKLYNMTKEELQRLTAGGDATSASLMELLQQRDYEMSEQEKSYMEVINNLQAQARGGGDPLAGAGLGVQKKLLDVVQQKDKEIEKLYKRLRESQSRLADSGGARPGAAPSFTSGMPSGQADSTLLSQLRQKEQEIEDYKRVIQQKELETDDLIKQENKQKEEQIQNLIQQLGSKQGFSSQKMWEIIQAKDQEIADLRRKAGRRETSATLMTVIQDKDTRIADLQRQVANMGGDPGQSTGPSPHSQMNSIREAKAINQVQEIREAYKESQVEAGRLRQEQESFAMQLRQRDEALAQKQQIINALQRQIEAYNKRIEEIENEKRRIVQDLEERTHQDKMKIEEDLMRARQEAMGQSQAQVAAERTRAQKDMSRKDKEQEKELQNMDEYHRNELALRDEQLQIVRAELEDARAAMRQQQQTSFSTGAELARTQAQMAAARAQGATQASGEVGALQGKLSQLQRQLDLHNAQTSSLQGTNQQLQDNMNRMRQAYEQQVQTLRQQVQQLRQLHANIEAESGGMKGRLDNSENLNSDLERTLEVLKQRLLEERQEFDRERQAMDRDYDAFKQFHLQFKQVLSERERMAMEVVSVKNDNQQRTNIMEQQMRVLQGEVSIKDEQLEKLTKQCQDLRADAKKMQRQVDNTGDIISDLKQSKQLIIAQTAEETQRLKEVTKELTSRLNASYTLPWRR